MLGLVCSLREVLREMSQAVFLNHQEKGSPTERHTESQKPWPILCFGSLTTGEWLEDQSCEFALPLIETAFAARAEPIEFWPVLCSEIRVVDRAKVPRC